MADSKLLNSRQAASEIIDLVQCGICYAVIDKPKALPCLHTFCLLCLSKWVESAAKRHPSKVTDMISCPSCRESFPLPPGGVGSLRSNFFVTKLKEKHSIERQLGSKDVPVKCTACNRSGNNSAAARCVDCNDFLCAKCLDAHRAMRLVKDHKILTLDELRSGELTMTNLPEQEVCSKHKGEKLRYHCQTCDEPTCRECMAVDHPQPVHKHVDLIIVASKRGSDLKELAQRCEEVLKEVKTALKKDRKLVSTLEDNIKQAKVDHMWLSEDLKSEILAMIAENSCRITDELLQTELKQKGDIEKHTEELLVIKARLEYVLKVAHQLTDIGSEHDLVTAYASISSILTELGKVIAKSADESLVVVKLESIKELILKLGVLGPLTSCNKWTMVREFEVTSLDCLSRVIADDTSITVSSNTHLHIFDLEGIKQATIDAPTSMEVIPSGDRHYHVKSINGFAKKSNGQYFVTSNSTVKLLNTSIKETCTDLRYTDFVESRSLFTAVTLDEDERLVVCGSNIIYPGYHALDWFVKIYKDKECEKTLPISMPSPTRSPSLPFGDSYVALTKGGSLVVSNSGKVFVFSAQGILRYGLEQPEGETVEFRGVCCSKYNDIYVATSAGIHRYSTKGDHIGVVTREVESPYDLALRDDDNELVVVESKKVKVFRLK